MVVLVVREWMSLELRLMVSWKTAQKTSGSWSPFEAGWG